MMLKKEIKQENQSILLKSVFCKNLNFTSKCGSLIKISPYPQIPIHSLFLIKRSINFKSFRKVKVLDEVDTLYNCLYNCHTIF